MRGADALLRGRIIVIGSALNKAFIIRSCEITLDEGGKQSENWTIRALGLKSVIDMRLSLPPVTAAYDALTADAETLLKSYVDHNAITTDAGRIIPNLLVAPNQGRGDVIEWQSRFKRLSDEVIEISELSGLGWNITLDYVNKNWVFDVTKGRDLTASQTVNPPIIFSPQFDSLRSMEYATSDLNYRSTAYVAGSGEGVARRVITVGGESTGMNRYEVFVDARDIQDTEDVDGVETPIPEAIVLASLQARGSQKLSEFAHEEYVVGQVRLSAKPRRIPKVITGVNSLGEAEHVIQTANGLSLDSADSYYVSQFQPTPEVSQGVNVLPHIDVSPLGQYESSKIEWSASEPVGTAVVIEYSLDGVVWIAIKNGQSLNLAKGDWLTGVNLQFRQRFFTDKVSQTPTLHNFAYTIRGYQTYVDKVFDVMGLEFEKDFGLGDVVTIQNRDWGVTLDARITEVTEIYEPSSTRIELTFGNSRPTLISKIKQEIASIKTEITK
jgi:hypothetical protein